MQQSPLRIAVIGAGASGALLTTQLCRLAGDLPMHISLFDPSGSPGPGLAYATPEPLHLLNVPAGKMSAFPDQPAHFSDWLRARNQPCAPADFVPRGLFGQYLQAQLSDAIAGRPSNVAVDVVAAEVTGISRHGAAVRLQLSGNAHAEADAVVLALGNFAPGHPCPALARLAPGAHYAPNPWAAGIFDRLRPQDPVLLVGTGLTMADVVMSLYVRNHQGPIRAISTHGHLPDVHEKTAPYTGVSEEVARLSCVKEWLVYIRSHVKQAARLGISPQAVVDAFRPYSQAFWLQLSLAEKRRFMRHLRHIWAVSRHRMPPRSAAILQQMCHSGQLAIGRGTVAKAELEGQQVRAQLRDRRGNLAEYTARLIVNCTGPQSDYRKVPSELVHNLLQQGLAKPDALHMGFSASPNGRLIDTHGHISDVLFSLGPPLKGVLWESTAIPEIRHQAYELAKLLLKAAASKAGKA